MELRRFEDVDAVAVSELINNWLWSYRSILEHDEFFLRAKRIEIPASITGVPFYIKMGYHYKNGISEPDEEHLIRMEKNR